MTEELFREDAYLKSCTASVTAVHDRGIELDRTVFYPTGGGQPGDTGVLVCTDGRIVRIIDTVKDRDSGAHLHVTEDGAPALGVGDQVTAELDWDRRYQHMRMHSALHCCVRPSTVALPAVRSARKKAALILICKTPPWTKTPSPPA